MRAPRPLLVPLPPCAGCTRAAAGATAWGRRAPGGRIWDPKSRETETSIMFTLKTLILGLPEHHMHYAEAPPWQLHTQAPTVEL